MTERGLPSIDGPVACPFVAFADDRDERAASPDHRHRCYAEATPAPRALAHQEAYCLASAFPVCPTFQDWARREAARARSEAATSAGMPIPGLTDERPSGDVDLEDEPVYEDRPRQKTHRDWAAPPPWLKRSGSAGPGRAADRGDELDERPTAGEAFAGGVVGGAASGAAASGVADSGAGLSGSFADRLVTPAEPPRQRRPVWRDTDRWDDEIRDGPDDADPADDPDEDDGPVGRGAAVAGAAMAGGAAARAAASRPGADAARDDIEETPPRRSRERSQAAARDRDDAGRREGPSWERPARLETFPSLRAQRMPSIGVPMLVVAAVAVVLAAILLFFLPGFLGIGSKQPGVSATPTVAATVAPTFAEVTEQPPATQQTYIVQSGDTMSKIAGRFHIALQTLLNANPQIKPPNYRINIGDVVTIPVAAPSTVPGATAAPSP